MRDTPMWAPVNSDGFFERFVGIPVWLSINSDDVLRAISIVKTLQKNHYPNENYSQSMRVTDGEFLSFEVDSL